jgi:parvulin-like peptidyl-prolyl isomerase
VRTAALSLALSLFVAACDGAPPTAAAPPHAASEGSTPLGDLSPRVREEIGETVATIDGMPIGLNEFIQLAGRKLRASEAGALTPSDRQAVIDELADQKLLFLEARRRGYDLDPKVQRLMVQLLLQDEVYGNVKSADLTDDELQAFFQKNHEEFIIPEKIRLRRIFIKAEPTRSSAEAKALADKFYQAVKSEPRSFSRLAGEVSEGPYRGRGGDLGLIGREPRPGVPQEIIDRGFTLKEGEVAAPFEAAGGWNVLYVSERRDRVERTFEQMRGAVVRRAKAEKNQVAYESYIAERRQGAKVEVMAERLDSVRLAAPPRSSVSGPSAPGGGEVELGGEPGGDE